MNYYDHHIRDYDAATSHLSWEEDLAYTRLIRWYYRKEEPIPSDIKEACRQVRAITKSQRDAVASVLKEFFELREDGWHKDTCDEAILHYKEGEPEREVKKANEENRTKRHREERARLFKILTDAGQHAPWNIGANELRAIVSRITETQPVTQNSSKTEDSQSSDELCNAKSSLPHCTKSFLDDEYKGADESINSMPASIKSTTCGKPVTAPATPNMPPVTQPVTAPATPVTATQYPIPNTQYPEYIKPTSLSDHLPVEAQPESPVDKFPERHDSEDSESQPPQATGSPPESKRNVEIAVLLRAEGVKPFSFAHPLAVEWGDNPAVTDDILTAAMQQARDYKPIGEISPNYLKPIIEQLLNPPEPKAKAPQDAWWLSNPGIERKGRELGMQARGTESYNDFKDRIFAEIRKREGKPTVPA